MERYGTHTMKKGPLKHSKDVIQSAITKFANGGKLSAIARELGVEKTTVKYWLDHANRFITDSQDNPIATRMQTRLTKESWDIMFMTLKEIKRKLPDATIKDLIALLGELYTREAQFGRGLASNPVPEKIIERSEELQVTVKRFLAGKDADKSLDAKCTEQTQQQDVIEAEVAGDRPKAEGNDAE